MKRASILLFVSILYFFWSFGMASASSYLASQGGSSSISFGKSFFNTNIRFDGAFTQITSSSVPSDPLIGSWQSIYVGNHSSSGTFPTTKYDYQLSSETYSGSGIWNLTGGEANIYITTNKPTSETAAASNAYFAGTATATTIDFNTGTVTWTMVAISDVNNPFGNSSALNAFSQYATGILTYTFETSNSLKDWIANPWAWGTKTSSFATQLTTVSAAPEPGTWALILTGLAFLYARLRNNCPLGRICSS